MGCVNIVITIYVLPAPGRRIFSAASAIGCINAIVVPHVTGTTVLLAGAYLRAAGPLQAVIKESKLSVGCAVLPGSLQDCNGGELLICRAAMITCKK